MYDAPLPDARYDTPPPDTQPPDTSVKVAHLVLALLFLGAAGIWALVETDVITAERLTVLAPALLIAAGVIGLAASLASSRNRRRRQTGATSGAALDEDAGSTHQDRDRDAREHRDETEPTRELR